MCGGCRLARANKVDIKWHLLHFLVLITRGAGIKLVRNY